MTQSQKEPPGWVKDAVFYQIFPDRFAQSRRLPNPSNLEPWDGTPTFNGFKGGDLYGVIERLDFREKEGGCGKIRVIEKFMGKEIAPVGAFARESMEADPHAGTTQIGENGRPSREELHVYGGVDTLPSYSPYRLKGRHE